MNYGNVPPPGYERRTAPSKVSQFGGDARLSETEKLKKYDELMRNYKSPAISLVGGKRKSTHQEETDYLERESSSDEEEEVKKHHRSVSKQSDSNKNGDNDDDDDELEKFMSEINKQAEKEVKESEIKEGLVTETGDYTGGQTGRDDIEQEDMHESMIRFMEEYEKRHEEEDDPNEYEYDEDGNIIWTWKKEVDPLPPIDHSKIEYQPFEKDFYVEHPDIKKITPEQVFQLKISLEIRVYGRDPPSPLVSFAYFQFDKPIMAQIRRSQFEKPTPIQAQAVPAALCGRDVFGLAQTGSGKTLAYIWPAIVHIMHQPELAPGDGPIALIVLPTRELAIQVFNEARKYTALYNIAVVCAYGGGSKYEQTKELEAGAELVIATPGRIIDLVSAEATNFLRTTFLVFDEVDRMFDLGFERQVKSIADHIRPDRQCLVFSATCKTKIEKLIMHALYDPIKILCGDVGEANADVQQTIIVLDDLNAKFNWLFSNIVRLITMGKVLIFVTKKVEAEDVAKKLTVLRNIDCVLLHGDMHQHERNERITSFRTTKSVMIATDVAARGLDIAEIRNVVNFDVARDIDTHVHRIGRTGRAGHQGFAYTLILKEKDSEFCAHLIKNLENSGQERTITNELLSVALKCQWFNNQYQKKQQSGQSGIPGTGMDGTAFKPKERPGFGLKKPSGTATSSSSAFVQSMQATQQPSISKQVERAKSLANTGNVAGMSRADMMRAALKGTFKNSFQRSSGTDALSQVPASDPRPEWKVRLDEQTAKINKAIVEAGANNESKEAHKKRSRWGT